MTRINIHWQQRRSLSDCFRYRYNRKAFERTSCAWNPIFRLLLIMSSIFSSVSRRRIPACWASLRIWWYFSSNESETCGIDFWPMEASILSAIIEKWRGKKQNNKTRPDNRRIQHRCLFFQNWGSEATTFSSSHQCLSLIFYSQLIRSCYPRQPPCAKSISSVSHRCRSGNGTNFSF